MKILLVDDDTELSKILATRLSRRGFEVSQAGGVAEAAKIFDAQNGAFQAILCDYHIGHGTGLDVFDYVAGKAFAGRFVVMSGDELLDERLLVLRESGKCHQLLKPFDLESLVSLIK